MRENQVDITGNLGGNPELVTTPSGHKVVNLRICSSYKGRAEWHRVTIWNKAAEAACKHLRKGCLIAVSGYLKNEQWISKRGEKQYATTIVARNVRYLTWPRRERQLSL
jgi:single-strand DNA-binding protein